MRSLTLLIAVLGSLVGCGGRELRCASDETYRNAISVAPVLVPDDLTPPETSGALNVPPPRAELAAQNRCLQNPPGFFEGAPPPEEAAAAGSRRTDESSRREQRRERRRARRDADADGAD